MPGHWHGCALGCTFQHEVMFVGSVFSVPKKMSHSQRTWHRGSRGRLHALRVLHMIEEKEETVGSLWSEEELDLGQNSSCLQPYRNMKSSHLRHFVVRFVMIRTWVNTGEGRISLKMAVKESKDDETAVEDTTMESKHEACLYIAGAFSSWLHIDWRFFLYRFACPPSTAEEWE